MRDVNGKIPFAKAMSLLGFSLNLVPDLITGCYSITSDVMAIKTLS